jgi:hypothetical protein
MVKIGGTPQVLITVGAGSPTTNDYVTSDDGTTAPELAYASHVAVTQ